MSDTLPSETSIVTRPSGVAVAFSILAATNPFCLYNCSIGLTSGCNANIFSTLPSFIPANSFTCSLLNTVTPSKSTLLTIGFSFTVNVISTVLFFAFLVTVGTTLSKYPVFTIACANSLTVIGVK